MSEPRGGGLGDIRNRLESIAEELADLAMERLREALASGDANAAGGEETRAGPAGEGLRGSARDAGGGGGDRMSGPRRTGGPGRSKASEAVLEERRLTRARRAVEKAAAILAPSGDLDVG